VQLKLTEVKGVLEELIQDRNLAGKCKTSSFLKGMIEL